MKRRSIFQAIAGLFAAPAVAAPLVLKPRSLGASIMSMPRDLYTAAFGGIAPNHKMTQSTLTASGDDENPFWDHSKPARWDNMKCPIATADGKITDYYYQPSEDGKSITLLGKV